MKKVAIFLPLLVVFVYFGGRTLEALFTEDLFCEKGSFEYFVAVRSPVIRHFPLLEPIDTPLFRSCCGDGPKPPEEGVQYRSSRNRDALVAELLAHIRSYGLVGGEGDITRFWLQSDEGKSFRFSDQYNRLEMVVNPVEGSQQIIVRIR